MIELNWLEAVIVFAMILGLGYTLGVAAAQWAERTR